MKAAIATLYATRDNYGDVDLFKTKPEMMTESEERYSNRRGFYEVDVQRLNTDGRVYSLDSGTFTSLTGRKVPRGKSVVKITLRANAKTAKGKKLFATKTFNGVELFSEQPKIVTEKVPQVNFYDSELNYIPGGITTFIKRKKIQGLTSTDAPEAIGSFCARGFTRGTGLSLPLNKVTPLTVKVTPVKG